MLKMFDQVLLAQYVPWRVLVYRISSKPIPVWKNIGSHFTAKCEQGISSDTVHICFNPLQSEKLQTNCLTDFFIFRHLMSFFIYF